MAIMDLDTKTCTIECKVFVLKDFYDWKQFNKELSDARKLLIFWVFQMLDFEYNGIYEKLLNFLKTDCIFCKVNTQNNF